MQQLKTNSYVKCKKNEKQNRNGKEGFKQKWST